MSTSTLPALSEICHNVSGPDSPLAQLLSILFEQSTVLISTLEPQLTKLLPEATTLSSYSELIDKALGLIARWELSLQSRFISGHPRIGETKNLSNLSAKEQGGRPDVNPTPPEVLARLSHLNACYEARYPGLRYITFVNGRSRLAIAEEMEDKLGLAHSLSPDTPAVGDIRGIDIESEEWVVELRRAVGDVGLIAKSRVVALGLE
ncbi:putative allantoinase 1 [Termitomyces sp. J132]|nr:putative allantoinase 1 [Termitomyces sp. J132]